MLLPAWLLATGHTQKYTVCVACLASLVDICQVYTVQCSAKLAASFSCHLGALAH